MDWETEAIGLGDLRKLADADRVHVVAVSARRPVWQSWFMCLSPHLHTILHERDLDLVSRFCVASLIPPPPQLYMRETWTCN